jgi:hypothetical protein
LPPNTAEVPWFGKLADHRSLFARKPEFGDRRAALTNRERFRGPGLMPP